MNNSKVYLQTVPITSSNEEQHYYVLLLTREELINLKCILSLYDNSFSEHERDKIVIYDSDVKSIVDSVNKIIDKI